MTASPLSLIGEETVKRAMWEAREDIEAVGAPHRCPFESGDAEITAMARAAISVHLAALKEAGWVMVPREPTEAMIYAGHEHCRRPAEYSLDSAGKTYRAMVSAAPPAQKGDEVKGCP